MRRKKKQSPFAGSSATIRRLRISIGLSVLFFLASLCAAQVDRSGLTGTITDPSGRLLPQAHVTVVENATGLRRETTSDAAETTVFPNCPLESSRFGWFYAPGRPRSVASAGSHDK
jgi:hypothetical protein